MYFRNEYKRLYLQAVTGKPQGLITALSSSRSMFQLTSVLVLSDVAHILFSLNVVLTLHG